MSIEAAATTPSNANVGVNANTANSANANTTNTNKTGIVNLANTTANAPQTKVEVAQFTPGGSSSATQNDYKELSDVLLGDDIGMMGSEVESWNQNQRAPGLTRSTSSFLPPTHPQTHHHSTPRHQTHAHAHAHAQPQPQPQQQQQQHQSPAHAFFAAPPVQLTRHASLPVNMMRPQPMMQMHHMQYTMAPPPHMMAMPPPPLSRQRSHTGYVVHAAPHHPHAAYGMPRLVAFHHPMSPMHHVHMHHPMNNSINLSVSQQQAPATFKTESKSNQDNVEPMPFTGMSDARMSLGEIDSLALAVLSEPSKNKEKDNSNQNEDKDNNTDDLMFKQSTASSIGCGQDLEKALDSLDKFLPEDSDLFRPSDFRPSDLAAMIAPPPPMQPVMTSHMVTPRNTGMPMGRAALPLIMSPHVKVATSPAHAMTMMMGMPHPHAHTPRASPKPMATCKVGGCDRRVRSKGFCKTHGGGRKCSIEGCKKSSQNGEFCIGHGGGKKCKQESCAKAAQSHGLCKAHGGGARCKYPNCNKSSQGGGLCRAHGGGKRCQAQGCPKGAQRGNFCATHGGFRNCKIDGCVRTDRGGGFCEVHRRGRLCKIDGCKKLSRNQGMCTMHIREDKQEGDDESGFLSTGSDMEGSGLDMEGSGIDA